MTSAQPLKMLSGNGITSARTHLTSGATAGQAWFGHGEFYGFVLHADGSQDKYAHGNIIIAIALLIGMPLSTVSGGFGQNRAEKDHDGWLF